MGRDNPAYKSSHLGHWGEKDFCKFKVNLGYTVRPCLILPSLSSPPSPPKVLVHCGKNPNTVNLNQLVCNIHHWSIKSPFLFSRKRTTTGLPLITVCLGQEEKKISRVHVHKPGIYFAIKLQWSKMLESIIWNRFVLWTQKNHIVIIWCFNYLIFQKPLEMWIFGHCNTYKV